MLDLAYAICTTPRTGSTSLLYSLQNSGVAGNPVEFPDALPTGNIYGTMVHSSQLDEKFKLPEAREHRYIYLFRNDIVAQAVSWEIASQTGKWQTTFDSKRDPIYNFWKIDSAINRIILDNHRWEEWLSTKNPVLYLSYEYLSEDYVIGTKKVLKFLGLPEVEVSPGLGKVGTGLNQIWIKRWKEENERIRNFPGKE